MRVNSQSFKMQFSEQKTTCAQTFPDVTVDTYQVEQRMAYFPSGMPVNLYPGQAVTDRLHLGKPWINLDGVGLYDNSARLHDAITCTFTTPDPLAYKFTSTSPYGLCLGNPVKFLDLDGEKPTKYESSLMALWVYDKDTSPDNKELKELSKYHWELSNFQTVITFDQEGNGLKSALFERTIDGKTEYAYVYAGTNPHSVDIIEDITQLYGISSQYRAAVHNARKLLSEIIKEKGDAEVTYIGHSKGGGEAIAAALATGMDAITFNPAAVSFPTRIRENLFKKCKIDNYISTSRITGITADYVTIGQNLFLHMTAIGERHDVPVKGTFTHSMNKIVEALRPK